VSRQIIKNGDVALVVETFGDVNDPAIILCQGLGMCIADWPDNLVERLSRRLFVVLVENRDVGFSSRCNRPYDLFDMAADIESVAAALDLDRFALLGFSMGGMIAQIVAARRPGSVTALVQLCSSAGEADPPFPDETRRRFERTCRGFVSVDETIDWLAEDAAYFAAPEHLSDAESRSIAMDMVKAGHSADAFARQYAAICGSGDRTDLLRTIAAPALVIAGDGDVCIPPDFSARAAALMPHATYVCLEDCGHWIGTAAIDATLHWLDETGRA
jgi:pimeloyl-ACP methyl ester carboxylesterase